MKHEDALRFAASAVDVLSVDDVETIITTYVRELARCAACDDTGEVTWAHDTEYKTASQPEQVLIGEGTVGPCPRCGGRDHDGQLRHDPEFVKWRCARGATEADCRDARSRDDDRHELCSYELVIPLVE